MLKKKKDKNEINSGTQEKSDSEIELNLDDLEKVSGGVSQEFWEWYDGLSEEKRKAYNHMHIPFGTKPEDW